MLHSKQGLYVTEPSASEQLAQNTGCYFANYHAFLANSVCRLVYMRVLSQSHHKTEMVVDMPNVPNLTSNALSA